MARKKTRRSKSRKGRSRKGRTRKASRRTSKRRGTSKKKRRSKGQIPLKILEKRARRLNRIVTSRGGSV